MRDVRKSPSIDFTPGVNNRKVYEKYYLKPRLFSYRRIFRYLEKARFNNTILDVGCGYGDFLKEAMQFEWKGIGVEPNRYQQEYGNGHYGVDVRLGVLDSNMFNPESFDVVTMWDVIEHVDNYVELIHLCRHYLRKGGYLLIKTPDVMGLLPPFHLFDNPLRWAYQHLVFPTNPPEHLQILSSNHLIGILKRAGFRIILNEPDDRWEERIIVGRNALIRGLRFPLMRIALKFGLPYEFTLLGEKI
jgi:SAM-dependent methyltransferase